MGAQPNWRSRALPFSIVLAVVAFMVEKRRGFALTVWSPLALMLLESRQRWCCRPANSSGTGPSGRAQRLRLGAFTVWSFVTISGPGARGRLGRSNRTMLYCSSSRSLRTRPRRRGPSGPLLAVGTADRNRRDHHGRAGDPRIRSDAVLIGSRCPSPLGYPSANAALFMTTAWLMIGLASRRLDPGDRARLRVRAQRHLRRTQPDGRESRLRLHPAGSLPPPTSFSCRAASARWQ